MSPTRRDILKASAGLVAASLAGVSPVVATSDPDEITPPQMVAVHTVMIAIRMDDGSLKTLTIADDHPVLTEAVGYFSETSEAHQPYSERIDPERARWASMWLGSAGMAAMDVLNRQGAITAW